MLWTLLILFGALVWLAVVLLGAWRVREVFPDEAVADTERSSLADVTVLIPARNEAATLPVCLRALARQGDGLKIVVIDDQSSDLTFKFARNALAGRAQVIAGTPLPPGWTGKLWALEQGRRTVTTRLTLLLDADIELQSGIIAALVRKMQRDNLAFVSLMAELPMAGFWEKLLMPAFVYFFKLVYPFRRANDPRLPGSAAAAGGCILLETRALADIGGFAALRGALIDDCTLAAQVKARGLRTWIGLTHGARSLRRYDTLRPIWEMVARTAFTQLRYSPALLLAVSGIFLAAFAAPPLALFAGSALAAVAAFAAVSWMMLTYLPVLHYYHRSRLWALLLPLIGALYLLMTWSSAYRYWRGQRSAWKGRSYNKTLDSEPC